MDMSASHKAGRASSFPSAAVVFDRFHIIKMLNQAVNHVRKKMKLRPQMNLRTQNLFG